MKREIAKMRNLPDRPKQQLPGEIIADLMGAIRNSFYAGDERWFKDQAFLRRRVVTWPAGWLNRSGVALKPERYKEIMLGIFLDIKRKGKTEAVRYWPGYLVHCVQEHFKHHGEEIYAEGKALRNQAENVLTGLTRALEAARTADPVAALAQVHQALTAAHKRKQKPPERKQMGLGL